MTVNACDDVRVAVSEYCDVGADWLHDVSSTFCVVLCVMYFAFCSACMLKCTLNALPCFDSDSNAHLMHIKREGKGVDT